MSAQTELKILPDGRMDTKNAAKYLGYAYNSLLVMRHNKRGPRFVRGDNTGKVFYYKKDLDSWLKGKG